MFTKNEKNGESIDADSQNQKNSADKATEASRTDNSPEDDQRPRSCSYVGPTFHIKGEVTVEESLNIEGKIEGTINSKDKTLTVGKKGHVKAEIHSSVVEARGKIEGEIHSKDVVHLYSTAVVQGTIHCARLIVDDGATFEGQIGMAKDEKPGSKRAKLTLASSKDD